MDGFNIYELVMSDFRPGNTHSQFFVLDNAGTGFHKVSYRNKLAQLSIDKMEGIGGFQDLLGQALYDNIVKKHLESKHFGE